MRPTAGAIVEALAGVRDPELDEPVTSLGFVADVSVDGQGGVEVALRLPTYFCAPNFAYLMVADARAAVAEVPGVTAARVRLVDHFAAEEINAGVDAGRGFAGTFPGLADDELDELRLTFRRKALANRQDRLCRSLMAGGLAPGDLVTLTLADLPPGHATEAYRQRRAELGIDVSPSAPLMVDEHGQAVPPAAVTPHLRRLRLIGVSIEANAGFCRGLLRTRYDGCWQGAPGTMTRAPAVTTGVRIEPGGPR